MDAEPRRPGLLTPDRVRMMLGVSAWSLRKMVRDGTIACVRLNQRTVRFAPEHVEAWINARQVPAKSAVAA